MSSSVDSWVDATKEKKLSRVKCFAQLAKESGTDETGTVPVEEGAAFAPGDGRKGAGVFEKAEWQ